MDINFNNLSNQELTRLARQFTNAAYGALDARSVREPPKIDPGEGTGYSKRAKGPIVYESLGQQLLEVRDAFMPGGTTTSELEQLREERALAEGTGSSGGFLLQDNFSNQLIASVFADPEMLGRLNKFSLSKGNNMKIPAINETSRADGSRGGGVQMFWGSEGAAKTESTADFRQIELVTKKLVGLIYATDEVLDDAAVLERYIRKAFTQEMRFKITDALINGTGAGMPLGILASPCLVTVAAEVGQANTTLVYENILNMYSRMPASSWSNSVWHINQDCLPSLFDMGITVGFGGSPVFMPAGGISGMPYNTLFGRPIVPLEACKTLGTLGDIFFCDWTKYIAIDRGAMQSAVSIHVKFAEDSTVFRSRQASHSGDVMVNSPQIQGNLSPKGYGNPERSWEASQNVQRLYGDYLN